MNAWSFSRYDTYFKCPYRAKLQYVDRRPVPANPQADRGTMLHGNAQDFVAGKSDDLHTDLNHFNNELRRLRQMNVGGQPVIIEEEWAWTQDFGRVCGWSEYDAWVRMKLDFYTKLEPTTALVVDLKTGKKAGNEIKHTEQGQLYGVGVVLREPDIKKVVVEFWYPDQKDTMPTTYSVDQIMRFVPTWVERGRKVTSGQYPPRPNKFSCKWCPFRLVEEGGDGSCEFAVPTKISVKRKPTSGFFDFGSGR
jgi:PD-(D/E)XK nuclease superfamily